MLLLQIGHLRGFIFYYCPFKGHSFSCLRPYKWVSLFTPCSGGSTVNARFVDTALHRRCKSRPNRITPKMPTNMKPTWRGRSLVSVNFSMHFQEVSISGALTVPLFSGSKSSLLDSKKIWKIGRLITVLATYLRWLFCHHYLRPFSDPPQTVQLMSPATNTTWLSTRTDHKLKPLIFFYLPFCTCSSHAAKERSILHSAAISATVVGLAGSDTAVPKIILSKGDPTLCCTIIKWRQGLVDALKMYVNKYIINNSRGERGSPSCEKNADNCSVIIMSGNSSFVKTKNIQSHWSSTTASFAMFENKTDE